MHAERTARQAAQTLLQALGSVTGCVTTQRLTLLPNQSLPAQNWWLRFREPGSLRANHGRPSGLFLDVRRQFAIVEPAPEGRHRRWGVRPTMYEYYFLDHDHTELLAYHWHPGPDYRGPDHPHLHVSASLNARTSATAHREIDLDKLHVATGHVSLTAAVRMLIQEFGVAPLRRDWQQILDRAEVTLQEDALRHA